MTHKAQSLTSSSPIKFEVELSDYFNIDELQNMQNLFSDATGVASIITKVDGTPITMPSNFCRLCKDIIQKNEKACINCKKSNATKPIHNGATPIIRTCTSVGLMETGVSIKIHHTVVAHWHIGQIKDEISDINQMTEYALEIGVDPEEYKKALAEVPVMSMDQFQKIAKMLLSMVEQLNYNTTTHYQLETKMAELELANKLLHKNEESLSVTLQSIGDGVISTDKNGLVVNMNPVAEKICGWKLSDAIGVPFNIVFNIIDATTKLPIDNPIEKVINTEKTIELSNHTILISKNGKEYQIADSAAPIINKSGNIIGVVLVFSDVTEKYAIQKELKESERSKAVLLSNIPGIAYRCKFDKDWTMEFVSEGCFALTGYQASDFENSKTLAFNDIIHPEYQNYVWDIWEKAVINKTSVCIEYKIITANNQEKWIWEQGVPVYNSKGKLVALEGLISDITDRKNAEEMLKKERHLLRSLIDNIPETIFAKDLLSRKTLSNKAEQLLKGFTSESQIIGKDDYAFFPKQFAEKYIADDQEIFETGKSKLNYEEKIIDTEGNEKWVVTSKIPLFDDDKNVTGLIGISRDITDKKQAEIALFNEKLLLRTIIDNIPANIYCKDINGNKTLANKAELELLGVKTEAEATGKDDTYFFSKELAEKYNADDQQVFRSGKTILYKEEFSENRLGIKRWIVSSKVPLRNKDNEIIGLVGISHDITENKKLEKQLEDERLLLRAVIDNIPDSVYTKDLQGRKTLANKAEQKLLGINSESETIGKTDFDFYPYEVATDYTQDDNVVLKHGGSIVNREGLIVDPTGRAIWTSGSKLPLFNHNNELVGLLGIIRDITTEKQALDALTESENFLKQTQSIAQLGTYSLDIITGKWECSDLLIEIFGLENLSTKNINTWLDIIHPDYKDEMFNYFTENVLKLKQIFDKQYKIIRPIDEKDIWIHGIGELKFNSDGEPIKMIGTIQDITKRKNLANKLRDSEAMYRSTLNASPDIITAINMDGIITMISPAGLTEYGTHLLHDVVGHHYSEFIVHEELAKANYYFETTFETQMGAMEYRLKMANGSCIDAELKADIIRNPLGEPTGMVVIIRNIAERKKWELELRNTQEQLKKFAAHLQNVREEERLEIARELHDELGQILIALKIDMGLLKQKVLKSSEGKDAKDLMIKFDDLLLLVDNTINTTRKIMTDLRPELLFLLGYIEAAKLLLSKIEERYEIKCTFETNIESIELNPQQSVAIYRITQEALTNVIKHASASLIKVQLILNPNNLVLLIVDNGIGLKKDFSSTSDSYGLLGMKERTFLLDGHFTIDDKTGNGTTVRVEIPYKNTSTNDNQLEIDY